MKPRKFVLHVHVAHRPLINPTFDIAAPWTPREKGASPRIKKEEGKRDGLALSIPLPRALEVRGYDIASCGGLISSVAPVPLTVPVSSAPDPPHRKTSAIRSQLGG